jgi:hypothetical protein
MANLSSKTGTITTPVQTQISLSNNATTSVQDMSAYDSQEVIGFVYVDATTDYRASFKVTVNKNGAGSYEIVASDIAGDDISGAPIISFSMSGSVLRVTLPSFAGFSASTSYLRYQLSAPFLGGNYPLSVSASQVLGNAAGTTPAAGYIGEYKEALGTLQAIATTTYSIQSNAGVQLTPGVWEIQGIAIVAPAATTTLLNTLFGISTTTTNDNTGFDANRNVFSSFHGNITNPNGDAWRVNTPIWRVNVTTTTTYYPKVYVSFGTSTCQANVNIFARRVG